MLSVNKRIMYLIRALLAIDYRIFPNDRRLETKKIIYRNYFKTKIKTKRFSKYRSDETFEQNKHVMENI